MQVDRIQRLIHSDNIDDIYLGYILMNDDKEFARTLLQQKKDIERLYILYNSRILLYCRISPLLKSVSETEISSKHLLQQLNRYLEENYKIYKHSFGYLMIINGEK